MSVTLNNSITRGTGDSRYLKLDCSNDPLTGNLDLGSNDLTTTGNLIVRSDTGYIDLGATANDYKIQWDGSDAVHTITAGDFVFSGGNVGIGDTAPNQKLGILGTNAQISIEETDTEFLRIGVGETAGTSIIGWDDSDSLQLGVYSSPTDTTIDTKMTILSNGNVGIGTTAPEAPVDIRKVNIIPTYSTEGILNIASTNNQNIDLGASITLGGTVTTGNTANRIFASIEGRKSNATSGNTDGYLVLKTPSSNVLTERMRITSAGNVGIGVTDPDKKLEINGSARLSNDNDKFYFGAGNDASISYNGTNFIFNHNVGSGSFIFSGMNNQSVWIDSRFNADLRIDRSDTRYQSVIRFETNGSPNWYTGLTDSDLIRTGNEYYIGTTNSTPKFLIDTSGHIYLPNDSVKLYFGAGDDASITYDGTDLNINPKVVGTGYVDILGALQLESNTLMGTPEAGTFEFSDDRMYITNVGTQRPIDRTSDVVTSTTTVSNTTTETIIYTNDIGANDLKAGNIIKGTVSGVLSNATAADDITIRLKFAGTTVMTFNPAIGNVTDANWHMEGHFTIRTVGAGGTYAGHVHLAVDDHESVATATGSVDTTGECDFEVTVEWDNAKVGNTISIYNGFTEFKN